MTGSSAGCSWRRTCLVMRVGSVLRACSTSRASSQLMVGVVKDVCSGPTASSSAWANSGLSVDAEGICAWLRAALQVGGEEVSRGGAVVEAVTGLFPAPVIFLSSAHSFGLLRALRDQVLSGNDRV